MIAFSTADTARYKLPPRTPISIHKVLVTTQLKYRTENGVRHQTARSNHPHRMEESIFRASAT
jgi:hypothetical protein